MMKWLASLLMRMVVAIYPYSMHRRVESWKEQVYTLWIRTAIGSLGEHSVIGRYCTLQGGGEKRLTIGHHTRINPHSVIGLWIKYGGETFEPKVEIGNFCNIGEYCHISAINKIEIGDGLLTGRFVYIGDNSHGGLSKNEADTPPELRNLRSKGEIMIGKNVWIGDKVTILGGVTIGDNVIIGANTVVTHDIPSDTVVGGGASRVIKSLMVKL